MKEVKFTHIFGGKKLSVAYYPNNKLKKVKGVENKTYPIYIRIVYDKVTVRVRSILWKRLIETNDFFFSVVFGNKKVDTLAQGYADIENTFIRDRSSFEQICEYEFECLKRIVILFNESNPENVHQVVNAYNFWGQDGLREVSKNIIERILDFDHGTHPVHPLGLFEIRAYPPISRNLFKLINDAMSNFDPVTLICVIDEINLVEKNGITGELLNDYNTLVSVVGNLIFEFSSFRLKSGPLTLGILYFPKIHFMYPISDDFSKKNDAKVLGVDKIQVADLMQLRKYLSQTDAV